MAEISEILDFWFIKRHTNLAKISLELLEKDRDNSLKLEKILINAGFEDRELFNSDLNFKLGRKRILDELNDSKRELEDLIKKFDIKLKG